MATNGSAETPRRTETYTDADDAPEHTPYHAKLLDKGLNVTIADKLDDIFKTDKLTFADLDENAFEALKEFPTHETLAVLAQLVDSKTGHISNKSAHLCDLMRAYYYKQKTSTTKETSDDDTYRYGPNPEIMADILDQSEYLLRITTSQRILIVPPEDRQPSAEPSLGYEVFCLGIPSEIFEDELIKLFEDGRFEIFEFRLMMDPATEVSRGYAFINYAKKEEAEQIQQKLNNFEIRSGRKLKVGISIPDLKRLYVKHIPPKMDITEFSKLTDGLNAATYDIKNNESCFLEYGDEAAAALAKKQLSSRPICDIIVDWAKSIDFPFEANDVHICKESSLSDYCTCITQMLTEISSLREEIQVVERITDKTKVDEAKEINKMQYACHSLRMERIEPNAKSLKKIFNASDYAVNHMDNVTLEYILKIHKKIRPDIKEVGMFRDEGLYINGIYDVPVYPSDVEFVIPEMEEFVKLLNETLNTDNDETAILMAATAKTNFLLTHPFFDGNGRCSRVIFCAILEKRNFPWIVIPISDSTRYYEALKVAQETKDLTLIYRFMCRCIRRSLKAYLENLRS